MPRRGDYRHREAKKPKKDIKKVPPVDILTTPANVEVIGKGGKKKKEEEVA
jgi:hypothetical protein